MPVTMTMSDMTPGPDEGDQGPNQSAASTRSPRAEPPKRRTFTAAFKWQILRAVRRAHRSA